jgi:hypothetical protein
VVDGGVKHHPAGLLVVAKREEGIMRVDLIPLFEGWLLLVVVKKERKEEGAKLGGGR